MLRRNFLVCQLTPLLVAVSLGSIPASAQQVGGPRNITFHSIPPGSSVYLETDGRRQYLGLTGHPILFKPPHLTVAAPLAEGASSVEPTTSASGYAGGRIVLKATGHQPLKVMLGPTDWLQDNLPKNGYYRLDPDNPWIAFQDYAQAYPRGLSLASVGILLSVLLLGHFNRPAPIVRDPLSSDEDPLIGRSFGPYRVENKLESRDQGMLYRATDPEGGEYAVKLLVNDSPAVQARFQRECRVGAKLHHPGLLRVIDGGEQDAMLYLVTELLHGRTLNQDIELHSEGLPWPVVGPWMKQVGSALAYAHEHGVLHRDLRPENIMIVGEDAKGGTLAGSVKVLGFGGLGHEARVYQAPEQRAGSLEARSDQYALGLILFQLLTGRLPSEPSSAARELVEVHPYCPAPLVAVVDRMLQEVPDQRYPGMRSFLNAIQEI